jgi:hypothetical protein
VNLKRAISIRHLVILPQILYLMLQE